VEPRRQRRKAVHRIKGKPILVPKPLILPEHNQANPPEDNPEEKGRKEGERSYDRTVDSQSFGAYPAACFAN